MPALLLPMDPFLFAARGFAILALFLVAWLIACGVNYLYELFSRLKGRRPRPMESQCVYVQKERNPARPPSGWGLPPARRLPPEHQPRRLPATRPFQAPRL